MRRLAYLAVLLLTSLYAAAGNTVTVHSVNLSAPNTFTIEGYTDAKGGDQFNQRLSDRRADKVKRYLVAEFHIPAKELVAVGYGKRNLKNPSDPFGAENRRVRIVNVAANVANE